jgi:polysaccharide pyruvyl transferase WcaK-like protein
MSYKNKNEVYHIFIAEEIPSLNKGEAAILMGILSTLRFFNRLKVSLLSYNAKIDSQRYPNNVDIVDAAGDLHLPYFLIRGSSILTTILHFLFCGLQHLFFMINWIILNRKVFNIMKAKLWKTYAEADVFLIGHNGVLLSTSSLSHFYIIPLAKILRKTVVIYAGGAPLGAFRNSLWIRMQKMILNMVDLILLREDLTYNNLKRIGINKPPMFVTADPAFLLKPLPTPKTKLIEQIRVNKKLVIGISVNTRRALHFFPGIKNSNLRYVTFIRLIAKVADDLISRNNAIVLIPHALDSDKCLDDRIIIKDIYKEIRQRKEVILIDQECSPEEIRNIIGRLDLLISTRLHAIIDAATMHVPFIALTVPEDIRMLGIIRQLSMEKYLLMKRQIDPNELIVIIDAALNSTEEIRKHLACRVENIEKQALKNGKLLKRLLEDKKAHLKQALI